MSKKQLSTLFICNLVGWTVGNGLIPLLPVYATRLGAGPLFTGYYLAFAYLTLALGTITAGWLSDALQRRKILLIIAGVVGVPVFWLMGQATTIYQLAVLTATAWFLGGMQIALLGILAGLFAEEAERGKAFGILGMTGALGSLLGGLTSGPVADRWGYPTLFMVVALWYMLFPLSALLLKDRTIARSRDGQREPVGRVAGLGGGVFLLLLASVLTAIGGFVAILGRSLLMNGLGFASAAISSTAAVGGAASLPLLPLIGWLSDRVGRKRLLILCYLVGTAGLLVLRASTSLWHFCVAISLMSVMSYPSSSMGSALVTDLVPQESLAVGMSLFQATAWVGGIIGYAGTGYAIEKLGMSSTFVMGAFLALIAAGLLIPIRETRHQELSAI